MFTAVTQHYPAKSVLVGFSSHAMRTYSREGSGLTHDDGYLAIALSGRSACLQKGVLLWPTLALSTIPYPKCEEETKQNLGKWEASIPPCGTFNFFSILYLRLFDSLSIE